MIAAALFFSCRFDNQYTSKATSPMSGVSVLDMSLKSMLFLSKTEFESGK